jgi:hypothetical protein
MCRLCRSGRFPKHTDVASWDMHESASDPLTRALVAPLRDAGFAVATVLSPTDALGALAKRRQKTAGCEAVGASRAVWPRNMGADSAKTWLKCALRSRFRSEGDRTAETRGLAGSYSL